MEVLGKLRLAAFLLVGIASASLASGRELQPNEYQVEAAFLFNFLKFVQWPSPAGTRPWTICVAGSSDFTAILEDTVRGKAVNGQPVLVKRVASFADAQNCNIAFALAPQPSVPVLPGVLTVGSGAIITFYLDDNQIRFEVRLDAAKAAGLQLSSQLLKLARIR